MFVLSSIEILPLSTLTNRNFLHGPCMHSVLCSLYIMAIYNSEPCFEKKNHPRACYVVTKKDGMQTEKKEYVFELAVKSLKEKRNPKDSSLRELSIKSSLAWRVLESILKVG